MSFARMLGMANFVPEQLEKQIIAAADAWLLMDAPATRIATGQVSTTRDQAG
jgi:hypothetical protein